jgi:cysteinyl-tRNA synthetase
MCDCNKVFTENKITDEVFLENILSKVENLLYIMGFVCDNKTNKKSDEIIFVEKIAEIREDVRKNKLFSLSDKIRDEIIPSLGYVLQDTPNGPKIKKA